MLRRMDDMPVGTIGFEAVGEVEDDDWEETVEPVLRREIATGAQAAAALPPRAGGAGRRRRRDKGRHGFRARHADAFERVAVVSDEAWVKPALRALSFLMPGKAKGFPVRDLPAAKAWLVEPEDDAA